MPKCNLDGSTASLFAVGSGPFLWRVLKRAFPFHREMSNGENVSELPVSVGHPSEESETADAPSGKKPRLDVVQERKAFWQRAATYTCEKWSAKPERLSPLTCSRFGWSCIKVDVLRCECCKAIIVCQLPMHANNQTSKQTLENAAAIVEGKLVNAHHGMCHWGWAPLQESCCLIDEVEVDDGNRVLESLKERMSSLADVRQSLAKVAVEFEDEKWETVLRERLGSRLMSTVSKGPDADVDRKLLWLALTGWRSGPPKADVLRCDRCARTVGLWTFEEPHRDTDEAVDGKVLSPLDQHRDWCPWVSGVRCGKEVEPAWKTFVNRLMHTAQRRPSTHDSDRSGNDSAKDVISSARKLVESWANSKDGAAEELRPEEPSC